ncbi:MAG TPA: hypothetical protein VFQ81_06165 [Candidatus Limnocylindria bacterium]|nr:hypothetical protein [Candidatus Limnocylindria bacterium]
MSGPETAELEAMRRLARRRILAAVKRLHRREPLRPDLRVDAVLREARADHADRRPSTHRGGGHLALDDDALRVLVDELVAAGELAGAGRRVRLPDHEPALDAEMRARVDRLFDGLREAGASPPRVDGIAARLGIPPAVLDQLRAAGELVNVGEGIDYPRDRYQELRARLDLIGRGGRLSTGRVRDDLRTSRRHAEALIAHRAAERRRHRT